jgi:DMSO/TMAO reductase YedYZ heme-binding membrane subunit
MLAHTVLVTWGYAVSANAVLSVRAVYRRIRYETWYYLHFYTYLALGLAFAHVFADGNEFRSNESARIAWSV